MAALLRSKSKSSTPDLVLSDMIMPEMDGIKLLDWLREYDPEVPVIMVTAIHDISTALEAIRRGAYDYILKPFEKDQLFLGVGRALQHRRLVAENRSYQLKLEQQVEERTAQLNQSLAQLEQSYDDTLEALGSALDLKDAETEGHCQRVTAFTISIAKAMPVPNHYLPILARAAFLHDIGKMAIPDGILRKPGPLTDAEKEIMRKHCEIGYNMLIRIPFLRDAAEIVLAHQEFYDGTGYPRGLKGEQIPLGARIFTIADSLDAMISDRPYRKALPMSHACQEISRCSEYPVRSQSRRSLPHHPRTTLDRPARTPRLTLPPRALAESLDFHNGWASFTKTEEIKTAHWLVLGPD